MPLSFQQLRGMLDTAECVLSDGNTVHVQYRSGLYSPAFLMEHASKSQGTMLARLVAKWDVNVRVSELLPEVDKMVQQAGGVEAVEKVFPEVVETLKSLSEMTESETIMYPLVGPILDLLGIKFLNQVLRGIGDDMRPNSNSSQSPSENSW